MTNFNGLELPVPKLSRVSRLQKVPGIGVDRMGNAADAAHDPEILRLTLPPSLSPALIRGSG